MQAVEMSLTVIVVLVLLALVFDFMNGFHDAANSIATIVSTGVLKPQHAVAWAAFFNVVAIAVFQLKATTLPMPAQTSDPVPALAIAAPAKPPIRAWDELEGMP